MYKNKKVIAIIPARSGSKGLKDKNIKDLNGKPLVAYAIKEAHDSGIFDRIIVSTDNEKYAEISRFYGAEVPFLRSDENSSDKAGSWDVVQEVLLKLNEKYDIVVLLQPTSPLRTSGHILDALELFFKKEADTVASVCETEHSVFWCNTLDDSLSAKNFIKKEYRCRRQDLPKTYTFNGAIYIIKTDLVSNADFCGENSYVYIMDKNKSVDIDNEFDFLIAEAMLRNL